LGDILSEDNITCTINTLNSLSDDIQLFNSNALKLFRKILYPLVKEQTGKHFERRVIGTGIANRKSTFDENLEVSEEAINTSIKTLSFLSKNLDIFRSIELKALRTSLHPLVLEQLHKQGIKKNIPNSHIGYTGQVSLHLSSSNWLDALHILDIMRYTKSPPKLGALQRWIRDADLAPNELRFPLIDAILRVIPSNNNNNNNSDNMEIIDNISQQISSDATITTNNPSNNTDSIKRYPLPEYRMICNPLAYLSSISSSSKSLIYNDMNNDNILYKDNDIKKLIENEIESDYIPSIQLNKIHIVHTIKGCDRRPPSQQDLIMYTLEPGTIILPITHKNNITTNNSITNKPDELNNVITINNNVIINNNNNIIYNNNTQRVDVPGVPGAFVIVNALTTNECNLFLSYTNDGMLFTPDAVSGINHVLWLADKLLIDSLFNRVKEYLPSIIYINNYLNEQNNNNICNLVGLNARFRYIYIYIVYIYSYIYVCIF
jgi:hypothetical protein